MKQPKMFVRYLISLFLILCVCACGKTAVSTKASPATALPPSATATPTEKPLPTPSPTPMPDSKTCLLKVEQLQDMVRGSLLESLDANSVHTSTVDFEKLEPTYGWSVRIWNSISVAKDGSSLTLPKTKYVVKKLEAPAFGSLAQMFTYVTENQGPGIELDFIKGNSLVSISVEDFFNVGDTELINADTLTSLGNAINQCLPDTLPFPEPIRLVSDTLEETSFNQYFSHFDIGMLSANFQFMPSTELRTSKLILFEYEALRNISNLNVAIYDPAMQQNIWEMSLFDTQGIFQAAVTKERTPGEYVLKIVADGHLVKEIPFTVVK